MTARRATRARRTRRTRRASGVAAVLAALVVAAAGCSSVTVTGGSSASTTTSTRGPSASSTTTATGATESSHTVWLCRPGAAADPCLASRASTTVTASGPAGVSAAATMASASRVDCFYVYPTVSREPSDNADLRIQPAEIGAAVAQASRFSQVCNVWAPMYRQRTLRSLAAGLGAGSRANEISYDSMLSGWEDYLRNFNQGRPFVLLGHSQGAANLIRLVRQQIDDNPSVRSRMLAAVILGGNVDVPAGKLVGGSFEHVPVCTSDHEWGCVIAYSTFPSEPPPAAYFGRPGQGVSLQWGESPAEAAGKQVVCVNPAALRAGKNPSASAELDPYFWSVTPAGAGVRTRWVDYPGLYSAQCESAGGASWLDVAPISASDPRPKVSETLGPRWGYHLYDVNLALGDLVADVGSMAQAYLASHA